MCNRRLPAESRSHPTSWSCSSSGISLSKNLSPSTSFSRTFFRFFPAMLRNIHQTARARKSTYSPRFAHLSTHKCRAEQDWTCPRFVPEFPFHRPKWGLSSPQLTVQCSLLCTVFTTNELLYRQACRGPIIAALVSTVSEYFSLYDQLMCWYVLVGGAGRFEAIVGTNSGVTQM